MTDRQHTGSGFICPRCGVTNYHPRDVGHGWCALCQDWTCRTFVGR